MHARHAYNTRTQDTHTAHARKACIQHTHARHTYSIRTQGMHTTHARKTRIQFSHARKTCIQHNIRHIELQLCLSKCLCKARPIDTNNTYKGSAARTVYMHHTSGHFPAKNTSFTVYIYMVLANPTHMVLINLTRTMSRPACACNTRACAYTQMHIRLHSYICLHQVAFILCVYVCVCVCVFHRPV
jgi:hypothetical protein